MTDYDKTRELLFAAINANIKAANDANAPLFARLAEIEALSVPTIPAICAKCFRVVAPGVQCPVCRPAPIPPRWAFEQVEQEYAMHHAWANYIACIEAKGGS